MTFLDCGSYRFFFLDILIYIIPTYPNFTSSVAAPALLSTILTHTFNHELLVGSTVTRLVVRDHPKL